MPHYEDISPRKLFATQHGKEGIILALSFHRLISRLAVLAADDLHTPTPPAHHHGTLAVPGSRFRFECSHTEDDDAGFVMGRLILYRCSS